MLQDSIMKYSFCNSFKNNQTIRQFHPTYFVGLFIFVKALLLRKFSPKIVLFKIMKHETALFGGFSKTNVGKRRDAQGRTRLANLINYFSLDWSEIIIMLVQMSCPYKDLRFIGYY